MRTVVIESPYAASASSSVAEHIAYARACVRDCLRRGESAYASHIFFTQDGILDDTVPEERKLGIEAGFAWGAKADLAAVYIDRGISSGMRAGIKHWWRVGQSIDVRSLEREVPDEEAGRVIQEALRP